MTETLPTESRDREVALPRLRMHFTESGQGTPVVLLHGFPQSSLEYRGVTAELRERAQLIVPDLPGAGRSGTPDGRYDLATLRGDLVAFLDALGLEQVALVAHDWSALIGFSLCLEHPERVSRFVSLATPPPYLRPHPAMVASVPYLWFQYALATPWLGEKLLSSGNQRLPGWLLDTFTAREDSISPADRAEYLETLRDPARAWAGSRLYRQLIVPEFLRIIAGRYRGRTLQVPALALFGSEDNVIPADALTGFEKDAPQLSIEYVAGAAHFLVDDQPVEVARRIARFLRLPGGDGPR